ncbi:MAG: T9SS type A sorting domain-containing protein [Bacteroidota bacterium]
MVKSLFISSLLILSTTFSAHAQCNGQQYLEPVFSDTNLEENISYGEATTIGGQTQELFLDVYDPQGDTTSIRPVIIFAHGNPFFGGSKEDLEQVCRDYAVRGYVAVAIDYRPFDITLDENTTEEQFIDWLVKAAGDMKAAVRFLRDSRSNGNPYGIGSSNFFVSGFSYGALVALHAGIADQTDDVGTTYLNAVQSNGGWDGNSNDLTVSSGVQAVVSYSGGLIDADWIDLADPVILAFHDEQDPVIPFGTGTIAPDGVNDILNLDGSSIMAIRADVAGTLFQLEVNEGSTEHLGYLNDTFQDGATIDESCEFYYDIICNGVLSDNIENYESEVLLYPNPSNGIVNVDSENPITTITVTNISGQEIKKFSNTKQVDLTSFENGLYYLQIEFQNGAQPSLKKVIKN